jgi:S1-C subfamily serine protease
LNYIARFFIASIFLFMIGFLTSFSVAVDHIKKSSYQTKKTLSSAQNISRAYNVNSKKAITKSVSSAVRVMSVDKSGDGISMASGTYFIYLGRYYVLTVSHAIVGSCEDTVIAHFENSSKCVEFVLIDKKRDYAILEVDPLIGRKPLSIANAIDFKIRKMPKLLDKTYYTGYPNNIGPLTMTGTISGFADSGHIFINSYAWTGSSGSGVFDQNGKLIGIIMALDVGSTQYGVDVLENLLIVVPTENIDWTKALHR